MRNKFIKQYLKWVFLILCVTDALFYVNYLNLRTMGIVKLVPQVALILGLLAFAFSKHLFSKPHFRMATIFLLWATFGILRGMFNVQGYWGYRGWLGCVVSVLSFLWVYVLASPGMSTLMLRTWNRYFAPFFLLLCSWAIPLGRLAFLLTPVSYFYGAFLRILQKNKWPLIIVGVTLVILLFGITNRSAVLKVIFILGLALSLWFNRQIAEGLYKLSHTLFYFLPILFLALGLSGTFNIFKVFAEEDTGSTRVKELVLEESASGKDQLTTDTRTHIYKQVISSARHRNYYLFGCSVGRGHDWNVKSDIKAAREHGLPYVERLQDETGLPNIFTWLGIVGLILYSGLFFQASWLGLYRSRNIYVKALAVAVAFHWLFGWLEESNNFAPIDFSLFLLLGLCLSPDFRRMSDVEFRLWFRSLFTSGKKVSPYDKFQVLKLLVVLKVAQRLSQKKAEAAGGAAPVAGAAATPAGSNLPPVTPALPQS